MHNPILLTAICAVVSFFIGAIPFGLILGRVFNHTDIRKAGSGNIGTTNALRVAGPKVAALTLLLDCLKGAICVLIARPLIAGVGYGFPPSIMAPGAPGDWTLGVICLAAVWGHIFSPYLNFHGGKAGDGGSPGAGANQRNIHDSLLLIVGLGDALGKRELGLLTGHELFDVRTMGPHHGDADHRHAKLKS